MLGKKEQANTISNDQKKEISTKQVKFKEVVEIRARKVRIKKSGIIVTKYKGDIIQYPWPELMQAAHLDSKHRVFAILKIPV